MVYLLAFTIPSKATYWNVPGEEEQEVVGGGGGGGCMADVTQLPELFHGG